jgi:hypothetical protein
VLQKVYAGAEVREAKWSREVNNLKVDYGIPPISRKMGDKHHVNR